MAQYNVTFACGHTQAVSPKGPEKCHARKIAWLRTQQCPACKLAAEQERARQEAAAQGLPELVGTAKQIAWALTVRRSMLSAIRQCLHTAVASGDMSPDDAFSIDQRVSAIAEARFWIENRDNRPEAVVHLVCKP